VQVPNIRFNVGKMLERLMPVLDSAVVEATVRPVLAEQLEDPDADVRYFAQQALAAADNKMVS
jgi:serine/threonine-protein phosphatase 2A regulatory subunit A